MNLETIELKESIPGHPGNEIQDITPLREQVRATLKSYFQHLNGHGTSDLYQLVIAEVERPLLQTAMEYTGSNQTRTAELLGISRSTLRKKLALYQLD